MYRSNGPVSYPESKTYATARSCSHGFYSDVESLRYFEAYHMSPRLVFLFFRKFGRYSCTAGHRQGKQPHSDAKHTDDPSAAVGLSGGLHGTTGLRLVLHTDRARKAHHVVCN